MFKLYKITYTTTDGCTRTIRISAPNKREALKDFRIMYTVCTVITIEEDNNGE